MYNKMKLEIYLEKIQDKENEIYTKASKKINIVYLNF